MAVIKVTSPVGDYSGNCGAVQFDQGVAYADTNLNAAELAYMRANGYGVEEDPEAKEAEEPEELLRPPRNGSAEAWRAYAVASGLSVEEAGALTRDQLVERFADSEENS
jgi:hypothetical protein